MSRCPSRTPICAAIIVTDLIAIVALSTTEKPIEPTATLLLGLFSFDMRLPAVIARRGMTSHGHGNWLIHGSPIYLAVLACNICFLIRGMLVPLLLLLLWSLRKQSPRRRLLLLYVYWVATTTDLGVAFQIACTVCSLWGDSNSSAYSDSSSSSFLVCLKQVDTCELWMDRTSGILALNDLLVAVAAPKDRSRSCRQLCLVSVGLKE